MKIKLDELDLYFPFKYIYPEQYEYLLTLKTLFGNSPINSVIQIPPALSKSICVFSFYVSSYLQNPSIIPRLVFSAKSVPEYEHAMMTLKLVIDYIEKEHKIPVPLLALCISEKKNLCINGAVYTKTSRESVNYECNRRIAPWVRKSMIRNPTTIKSEDIEKDPYLCGYYEGYFSQHKNIPKLTGCYSLEDLREYGKKHKMCPYFLAEDLFQTAQIILCDYFMLFGMKKSNNFDRKLLEGAFLVIDECCGMDEAISEMFTERVSRISLDYSLKCVDDLNNQLKMVKETNMNRYNEEYKKLVQGLTKDDLDLNQINKKNAVGNSHIEKKSENDDDEKLNSIETRIKFPGYIRKPEHFITHLKKFILFLKGSITKNSSKIISHSDFLDKYLKETLIDPNLLPLAYFPSRLRAMANFLQNVDIDSEQFLPLQSLVQFAQLFGSYATGFELILYNIQETNLDVNESSLMVFSLCCLDPSGPFAKVTSNIGTILFHSETLAEVDVFAKILELADHPNQGQLDFSKIEQQTKLKVFPIIVSKGADQIELSTEHAKRHDAGVMRNYSNMIVRLSEAVPDGILCMFPNMRALKDIGLDFYDEILEKKLIFPETLDVNETSKSVSGYVQACETGRGGVFMGLLRGKVLGNIALPNRCGKCVIIFGVPLEFQRPREFLARAMYFKLKKQIQETDYVVYSCMKEVNKPLGKLIRKRDDACVIIYADKRFLQADKISRLPSWVQKSLDPFYKGVPGDQASYRAAKFYKNSEFEKEWKKYAENDIEKLRDMFQDKMTI